MNGNAENKGRLVLVILGIAVLIGLCLLSYYNYLVFHSVTEVAITVVAGALFVITWHSRKFLNNNYLLFIGIAYLFVGIIGGIHMLAYSGMNVFPGNTTNLSTQLWLAARFMESSSLLIAPFFIGRKLNARAVLAAFALLTALFLGAIFYWKILPVTFVEGVGLTPFKVYSEYAIVLIFLLSLIFLYRVRQHFDENVFKLLSLSIVMASLAELSFTAYTSPFDILNFSGHIFTIASFYLIYRAIIVTGIENPYNIIFRSLKESECKLKDSKAQAELYVDLMAHDINNMNQIGMGSLELVLESGNVDESDRALLIKALNSLMSSSGLIENVRKIRQVKMGHMLHEPVDLGKLLEEVKAQYSNIPGKKVTITYQPTSGNVVMANDLLRDVFSNLAGNAVKHSGDSVDINIALKKVDDNGVPYYRVDVEDNGPGIPDELKSRLFKRYERGDTYMSGHGLGLFLVKTLVENFHGKVWVEDRVPGDRTKGSRFVVLLPAVN